MDTYSVTLTFMEPVLGTVPKNKELYDDYILAKAEREGIDLSDDEKEQELSTVKELADKRWTGFHTLDDGTPAIYDYAIRGFLKSAAYAMRKVPGSVSHGIRAYKKIIDTMVFVYPRLIPLVLPDGGEMGVLERPLRAQTAQGERVALAISDTCPVGTTMTFTVEVLAVATEAWLHELFSYGKRVGLGQWRSGSWGRVSYEMRRLDK